MLVREVESIELEGWRGSALEGLNQAPSASAVAADGIDADGVVGGDEPACNQWAQEGDGGGRVAAGIGNARGAGDCRPLAAVHLGKSIDPAAGEAVRGGGIDQL